MIYRPGTGLFGPTSFRCSGGFHQRLPTCATPSILLTPRSSLDGGLRFWQKREGSGIKRRLPLAGGASSPTLRPQMVRRYACWWTGARVLLAPACVKCRCPQPRCRAQFGTSGVEEIWYVLEGRGQVWRCPPEIDAESVAPRAVAPGDALTVPPRRRFQFASEAGGVLRFLCFTAPPWPGPSEARPAERGRLGPPTL